jgi:hypothetical protein
MEKQGKPKSIWEYIKIYFPDMWQYLIVIIVMILAAIFIL